MHINSGVQNFFFYLLSDGGKGNNDGILYTVDGIGIERASKIAVETNAHYVNSQTDHLQARQAWIDAAAAIDPTAVETVKAAWDAVGVPGMTDFPVIADIYENFDSGSDSSLPVGWDVSGSAGWERTTLTGSVGSASIQSSPLGNQAYAAVSRQDTFPNDGYLAFDFRTSTEKNYDHLQLYIDGTLVAKWSGENAWRSAYFPVTAGAHAFDWAYMKDQMVSAGLDQV